MTSIQSFMAVAAVPTAHHVDADPLACVWMTISEHDTRQAAYSACNAYAASGQPYDALMVVSSDAEQYIRFKLRLLESVQ